MIKPSIAEEKKFAEAELSEEQKENLKTLVHEFLGKYANDKDKITVLKTLQFTINTMIKEPMKNRSDLGNSMIKLLESKAPGNIGALLTGVGFSKKSETLYEFEHAKLNEKGEAECEGMKGNKNVLEEVSRLFEELKS